MRYRALLVCPLLAICWTPAVCPADVPGADQQTPPAPPLTIALDAPSSPVVHIDLTAPPADAAPAATAPREKPVWLAMFQDPDSIYAPPTPPREDEGINSGGVNFLITFNYMTDYVYRGIDRSEVGGAEDAPNLQFDARMSFNLGKLPHPVIGLFVNVYNDDPVSRFQEIRPFVGLDWTIKPITLSAGWITYIFPEREDLNTSEVYGQIALDDAFLFKADRPVLHPYVYGAYDYDRFDGLYLEAGISHDFPIQDTPIVITALADIGFAQNSRYFSKDGRKDTGFQHYDIGLIATYSLNSLMNIPRRFGEFKLKGYLYYTGEIDNQLRADAQIWGGMGVAFEY